MKMTLTDYFPAQQSVKFVCAIGCGSGQFYGGRKGPSIGEEIQVEFEVLPDLVMGLNARPSQKSHPCIEPAGSGMRITGWVESVDEDGMMFLRLAVDGLVMVQLSGEYPPLGQLIELDLAPGELRIFRYD